MDPRERADVLLSRARARGGVVTPDNMTSPMDAVNTQQIPRSVVTEIDRGQDPDTTTKLPSSVIEASDTTDRMPAPSSRPAPGGAGGAGEPLTEVEEQEVDGLIPTIKTRSGQSELSRRLEGL
ncbi:hypothetical protein SAMN05421810_105154 [Amycolatopsis arida]|uniref:Uncharacterized protein n=1 Tax=Amycolatopsis arida TaxID=587909 RepID=A0A1I5WKI0_9PSEU|nr:hypothetical protein [Amycolatopsis arida]TDX92328.1 hypothetical protein CLV69_105173 [Amycolatopsis arida]SFQ20180.1 hypothetical protein SAMN05421810_105154 [Amycolatopsis arida]